MFERWDPRAFELYLAEGMRDRRDGQVELKCSGEIEASIFEQGRDSRIYELAPDVSAPTRIVWAKHGDFPRLLFEQLAARLPHGSLSDADTGHLVPMENPAWVVEYVLKGR
jgi:pimeloyl-ACP methyl ester carboxylesterase